MRGQMVLAAMLALAPGPGQTTSSTNQGPPEGWPYYQIVGPNSPRPPAEIPLARVPPDAVLKMTLGRATVASDEAVWVADRGAGTIVRIDPTKNALGSPIPVGPGPCASLVVAFNSVWVPLCDDRQIARVDPKDGKVTATLKLAVASADGQVATSVGSVWVVSDRKGVLTRIDPETNAPVGEIYVPAGATAVVAADDALWVTSEDGNRLTRVNAHSHEIIESIAVGPRPGRIAVGEGGVWTLNRGDGSVTRVDPATNKVVATVAIGAAVAEGDIAAGAGSVWISAPGTPIVRIDPRTNRAVQRFTGDGGGAILVAHQSLWVAAGPQLTWRLDPQLVAGVRP